MTALFTRFGLIDKHPEANHAAHRKADEMGLLHSGRIQNANGIRNKHIKRIIPCRRSRLSVASGVISKNTVAALERCGEFVPHGHIGRQTVTEHDPRAVIPIDPAVEN